MQRKGNTVRCESQSKNLVTVGIDMGGSLWATAVYDWDQHQNRYYPLKDKNEATKEDRLFELIAGFVESGKQVEVFYEAGRYGYWPARRIREIGGNVHILPINKLKVIMCGKVIKTDKLDAQFMGGLHPEDKLPEVYIPTLDEEGRRDAERELIRLTKNIGRTNAQLLALIERTPLATPRCHRTSSIWKRLATEWSATPEWEEVPKLMLMRLQNMINELELFEQERSHWQETIDKQLKKDAREAESGTGTDNTSETVRKLNSLKGVGAKISRHLPWEIGDFERFKSGKHFASYFGLTPCPYASGTMKRDQGISKSGRKSLRKMAIEAAWLWYRWQPDSWLVKKWQDRLDQKGRSRRTAIVALARQLMVALWRYVVHGEMIEGAIINKPIEE